MVRASPQCTGYRPLNRELLRPASERELPKPKRPFIEFMARGRLTPQFCCWWSHRECLILLRQRSLRRCHIGGTSQLVTDQAQAPPENATVATTLVSQVALIKIGIDFEGIPQEADLPRLQRNRIEPRNGSIDLSALLSIEVKAAGVEPVH